MFAPDRLTPLQVSS